MEVCDRTEAHRKGGHLARLRGGGLVLREIAQCPEDELDAFQDVKRYRFFNTNNLWVDLDALAAVLREHDGRAAAADDPQREDRRPRRQELAEGDPARDGDGRRDLRVSRARARCASPAIASRR